MLVVPCPPLPKVSWGCWAAGRKECASCFFLLLLALGMRSGTAAWWLELKPELPRKTYRQKHCSYTSFCIVGVTMSPTSAEPKSLGPNQFPSNGREDEDGRAYGRKDDVRTWPGARLSYNYILSSALQNLLFVRF